MRSDLSGFHRLTPDQRLATVAELADLDDTARGAITGEVGLDLGAADLMVENVLGVHGLPFAVCTNLHIDGVDRLAPMVIEEPSVVAAASHAAKLLRAGGGITSTVTSPLMVGQVQVLDVPDAKAAEAAVLAAREELLEVSNSKHLRLRAAGGGAVDLEVRHLPALSSDDPVGDMLVLHLVVDVRDAMGANAINAMCERIAPRVEALTGGRVRLRILSNLSDRRLVTVRGLVPWEALAGKGGRDPQDLARGIEEASVFAERDPYRAATHNKGIMNGVDAVLLALGQDWRAVEAGAHAYAARDGRYTALATWRVTDDGLQGEMTLPMAVGTVGGVVRVHPTVKVANRIADVRDAADLATLVASVGLAQNLGALRALSAEGIQRGHMRLHARNIAVAAGAKGDEVRTIAERISAAGTVRHDAAADALRQLRA
jgi:hydroxymethylglutaryl-CoA reductase